MTNPFTIRAETATDRADVATVLARSYLGDGAAAIIMLSNLRELPAFKQDLALVGIIESKVSAFAALTPVKVGTKTDAALLLAPIAVDPQTTAATAAFWVDAVLHEVARQKHRFVLVQGAPGVYQPHGFVPARNLNIHTTGEDDENLLLVKDLNPNGPVNINGEVEYPHA